MAILSTIGPNIPKYDENKEKIMPGPTTEETAGTAPTVATAAGTVILDVSLDTSANPPVIISNRIKKAAKGDKIKWKKKSGSLDFKFTDFAGDDPPFDNVDKADKKIECDFEPPTKIDPEKETDYPYTITVKYNGESYTSDETGVSKTEPVALSADISSTEQESLAVAAPTDRAAAAGKAVIRN